MVDLDVQKQDEWIKQFFPEQESQLDEWVDDIVNEMGLCTALAETKGANLSVNWVRWLKIQEWTKEQAAYLICGIDPFNNYFTEPPPPVKAIITTCYADLKLDRAPPFEWLRWFDKVGLLDVSGKLTAWYNEQLAEKELAGDLPLDDSLLSSVVNLSLPKQGRREKQLAAILGVIEQLELAQMKIPEGEKKTIESVCREKDKPDQLLFGVDGSTCFENAWKVGRKQKLFKMENNDIYAKRGK